MMTEASTGLRKALARNAGVSKLTAEELLAEMSEEQKTAIAASLAPAASAGDNPEPEAEAEDDDDDAEMKDKKKSKKDGDDDYMGEDKAEDGTARALAVMSSEHFAGREKQAAKLLANAKLSSGEIVDLLAGMASATTDPEAADRAEMQAALKENAPSAIEANNAGTQKNPAASAADVWAFATGKVFGNNTPA